MGKKQSLAIFAKNIIDSGYIFYEGKEENVSVTYEECLKNPELFNNNILLWVDIKSEDGKIKDSIAPSQEQKEELKKEKKTKKNLK